MTTIPRRLSTDDQGYDASVGAALRVSLDGEDQEGRCTGYDLDAQTVTRCLLDAAGHPMLNEAKDAIELETVHGVVEVTLLAEAGDAPAGAAT